MPVEEQVKENQAEEKVGSEQAWLQQQNKLTSLAISIDSSKEADGESASKVENVSIMPLEVAFCETMMEQSLALGALSHLSAVLYPLFIYQEDIHCQSTQMMSISWPASQFFGDQISCTAKYKRLHFLMLIL